VLIGGTGRSPDSTLSGLVLEEDSLETVTHKRLADKRTRGLLNPARDFLLVPVPLLTEIIAFHVLPVPIVNVQVWAVEIDASSLGGPAPDFRLYLLFATMTVASTSSMNGLRHSNGSGGFL
jgi:hypothetical protein